jgi:hypothetical protein
MAKGFFFLFLFADVRDGRLLEELFLQYAARPKLISQKLQVLKEVREMMDWYGGTTELGELDWAEPDWISAPSSFAVPFATIFNLHPDFSVEVVKIILSMRLDLVCVIFLSFRSSSAC